MKKILVLGSSAAAAQVAEEIRRADPENEIVLMGFDGCYPYDGYLFAPVLAREMDYSRVFSRDKKFYEQNHIQVVLDKKITRINLARTKVTTEDKMTFAYDVLIIAGAPAYRLPPIKGANKNGIFTLTRLKEVDNILDILPHVETVVVQSQRWSGLQAVCAFLARGKDVVWIIPGQGFSPPWWDAWMGGQIAALLEAHGVRMVFQNSIAEILGEGEARAIRLMSGKVMAAQMIILADAQGDFRLFADSPLQIHDRICVDDRLRTNIENVFAVGSAAQGGGLLFTGEEAMPAALYEEEARVMAAALKGQPASMTCCPVVVRSVAVRELTIDSLAKTPIEEGHKGLAFCDHDRKVYKKVWTDGPIPLGACLINAREELEKFRELIDGKRALLEFPELAPAACSAAHPPQELFAAGSPQGDYRQE